MPCDLDHEHAPWPTEGEFELFIEACETQCGWCSYSTKHANNLRVHAHRHIANPKDGNLRRITIVKGRAGRKRVHMTRQPYSTPNSTTSVPNPRQSSTKARSPIRRQSISQYPLTNPWESRDAHRGPWEFSPKLEKFTLFRTPPAIDMMLDTDSEFRAKLSNVSSYVSDLDVQTMRRADAFQHASEEETGPAALPNSNGDTSRATHASLATSIPSGKQQRSPLIISPEKLNQVVEKFAAEEASDHAGDANADADGENVVAVEEASDTEYRPKSTHSRKRRAFNQRVTSSSPRYEQREAQMKVSNMQAGRRQMPTQTDSQMPHSSFKLSFPAYPTKDDTLRDIDDILDLLQIPTSPIDFLEDRKTISDMIQRLRGRHCDGLLDPAEMNALNSALRHRFNSPRADRKEKTYWAVTAIYRFMNETLKEYSSYEFIAITILRTEYSRFLVWPTSSRDALS